MNAPKKSLLLLVLFVLVLLSFSLLACDDGPQPVIDTLQDANNSCNDITSCVGDTPQVLSNLCEVTGNTRDASGNCIAP